MEKMNETLLWQNLKKGNKSILDFFYDAYVRSLYNYGRKITDNEELVKDCIQELFIDLWRNRNNLEQPRSIKFYLLKSLRYKIVYQIKKDSKKLIRESLSSSISREPVQSYEFDLISQQLAVEKQEQLKKGLKKLSNRQREAILLKFYEELSYDEIASVMSINAQSVYNLINQSIDILKKSVVSEFTLYTLFIQLAFLLYQY